MTRKIEMTLTHILIFLLGIPAMIIGVPICMLARHMIKVGSNQRDADIESELSLPLVIEIWTSPIRTLKTIWATKD